MVLGQGSIPFSNSSAQYPNHLLVDQGSSQTSNNTFQEFDLLHQIRLLRQLIVLLGENLVSSHKAMERHT